MPIFEVIARVKAYCQGTSADGAPIDDATARDQVLWGTTDRAGDPFTCVPPDA